MKKTDRFGRIIATMLIIGLAFSGIAYNSLAADSSGKVNISLIGKYDSADTAAIRAIDTDRKIIRLRNHSLGKTYTLSYDNTSMMYDAYGNVLSPRLLEVGQIVDVTFLKSNKIITSLNVNKDAWYIESTRDHELVRSDGTVVVKGDVYKMDTRALVLAEGQLSLPEDILSTDSISVRGVGKEVYSVIVTGGHGYVSLSSDTVENQSLVGAWLELDNVVINKITPNMLLSAPEGDYNLQILGNGANYQSKVNVSRNQETVIDTSNVTIAKPKEGLVTFKITPATADVFVDGERMLKDVPQSIQYGYHKLKILADGYLTQSKYLKVGTPKSVIELELEKDPDAATEASSELVASSYDSTKNDDSSSKASTIKKTVSANSADTGSSKKISENSSDPRASVVINGYKIYIDEPNGAEVYFDGNYVGIIPCHLTKVSGTHEIILKKEGYQTKSYRINIDREETDLAYKFPKLKKVKDDDDSSSDASSQATSAPGEASTEASSEDAGDSSDSASSDDSTDETSTDSSEDSGGGASSSSSNDEEAGDAASTASGVR